MAQTLFDTATESPRRLRRMYLTLGLAYARILIRTNGVIVGMRGS